MTEKWNERGRTAANAVKRGAEATANGIHTATNFVARNDGRVADGAQAVTQVLGGGLDKVAAVSPQRPSRPANPSTATRRGWPMQHKTPSSVQDQQAAGARAQVSWRGVLPRLPPTP
jgi:hypothetical protein